MDCKPNIFIGHSPCILVNSSDFGKYENPVFILQPVKNENVTPLTYVSIVSPPFMTLAPPAPSKTHFQASFGNMNFNLTSSKTPKRKVYLTPEDQLFKENYYKILTTKKKFSKCHVKAIHDLFINKELGVRPISREEFRRIDLYFSHFSKYKDKILPILEKNKDYITSNILGKEPK